MLKPGDCRTLLKELPDNSVDSIVTDPPYELAFMGKTWDASGIAYNVNVWKECLRVLKPGGHLLAFGGTRTHHRMVCAIEDAGFEIRDELAWLYSSGFPKSLDISKALGKIGEDAETWQGWGTALKPAHEPITLARKPIPTTLIQNVSRYGTGGLNIDASRIAGDPVPINKLEQWSGFGEQKRPDYTTEINTRGRWPANVLLDEYAAEELDRQSGISTSGDDRPLKGTGGIWTTGNGVPCGPQYGDTGGASRFFYVAKPSRAEREAGCELLPVKSAGEVVGRREDAVRNTHPTVKPITLMRYLCVMVTPPGGIILDPFMGSGSTGCACVQERFRFIGIDLHDEHVAIAKARIAYWQTHTHTQETPLAKALDTRNDAALF